jgi:hypothetical protein
VTCPLIWPDPPRDRYDAQNGRASLSVCAQQRRLRD